MYVIKWIENGKEKSVVADSWITRDVLEEEFTEQNISFVTETL